MRQKWATLFFSLAALNTAIYADFNVVRGANSPLELIPDARTAALGGVRLGLPGEAGAEAWHPAALADAPGGWFHLSHTEHFLDSRYDGLSFLYRPDERDLLAFSLARFGTDGIPLTKEGEIYEGEGWESFSIADWIATTAFARRWGNWRIGGSLHLLWRDYDQTGWGMRTDLSGGWSRAGWRVDAAIKSLSGSAALWESGWKEISPPDLFLGVGWLKAIPYFYGEWRIAWQSAGIFQKEGKSSAAWEEGTDDEEAELIGARAWEEPLRWLAASSVAMEFVVERWVTLRVGFPSLHSPSEWSAGGGVRWRGILTVDYAFRHHPELRIIHQVTLGISPWKLFHPSDDSSQQQRPYAVM